MADQGEDTSGRPVIELFVKAAVDKMKNGSCPICHRYFLVFYKLRENALIDLVVTTFLPENPPKEVLEFTNGRHYPLVKVHKGVDSNGQDMTGLECDTIDDIEKLLDRFESEDMAGRRESKDEAEAERTFEDLYKKFNLFLRTPNDDPTPIVRILLKIDAYLKESGHKFLLPGDKLCRADCYLLPTLQHIRVAGRAFKGFEIPRELNHLWRYIENAYETDAFRESCPADGEIINHYVLKSSCAPQIAFKRASLMRDERTLWIPKEVNSSNGDIEEEVQEDGEVVELEGDQ